MWDCGGNKQDKGPNALEGRHLIRGIVLDLLTDYITYYYNLQADDELKLQRHAGGRQCP